MPNEDRYDGRSPTDAATVEVDATPRVRMTKATMKLLDAITASRPDDPIWGLRICLEADLGTGKVYPILERLTEASWIDSWREDPQPSGRPRRRFYRMTDVAGRNRRQPVRPENPGDSAGTERPPG